MGKERENSYQKLKRSPEERHTQKQYELIQNILTITDVFLNQKRVNKCIWTHGKDGITWVFKRCKPVIQLSGLENAVQNEKCLVSKVQAVTMRDDIKFYRLPPFSQESCY